MQVHSGYSALAMFDVAVMLFTLWESMLIIIIDENYADACVCAVHEMEDDEISRLLYRIWKS